MKKLIIATGALCLILSGCVGFQPLNSTSTANTAPTKSRYAKSRSSKSHQSIFGSSQISLNDFTDLSLNNYHPTQGNLWDQIGEGLKIDSQENRPEVQAQIRWFMNHPSYLERTTERARPYLYIVYQEVKSRNLPTELVLLPINESAYYPFSYSSAGATGIWQLMPGTASDFGLKRNFWYDGRRDIFDSTNAALDYLTYLAHYFNGDWLLAIAAYDTGEGNVERAIARNARAGLPTDFWSLHLASETRSYVPRLMALAAIIAHPDRYPVTLPPVDAKAVVAPVHIAGQIKLADAAKFAGISINQLKLLNPGLSHTSTDPSGDSKLLLPISSIDAFKENLTGYSPTIPDAPPSFGQYRVQRGDTLDSIATRFGISVDDLRNANHFLRRYAPPGKVLLIPNVAERYKPKTQIDLNEANLQLTPNAANTTPALAPIQNRATLDAMNRRNIPITLTNQNDDDNLPAVSTPISANVIKKVVTSTPINAKHVIKHKVAKGETLSSISRRYHISVQQLTALNPGVANRPLKPGTALVIQATNSNLLVSPKTGTSITNKKSIPKKNTVKATRVKQQNLNKTEPRP